jgi:uncharacterized protein YggE
MSDQFSRQYGSKLKALTTIAVLTIGVLAATMFASQALSTASAQSNEDTDNERPTVSTSGMATIKVDPDKVSVSVGAETDGATSSEAVSKNAELMDKIIAALQGLGITDDELSTGYFSVYPVYEYQYPPCILNEGGRMSEGNSSDAGAARPAIYPPPYDCQPQSVITGYKATNSLTVTLDGGVDVGEVIDTAVEAGANNINGAYFFVSTERQEDLRESLIEEAIANARSRADKGAQAVDMSITGVKSINLNDVYFPMYYERSAVSEAAVGSPTPILPGEQEITMTVQVTYFIG